MWLGHVIYPLRYMNGPYDTPDLGPVPGPDPGDPPAGHRLRPGHGDATPGRARPWPSAIPLLQDYKELGGEILTVGSDAHAPGPLGKGIREAYTMMADCGFRYVAVYHERKPEMIRLK